MTSSRVNITLPAELVSAAREYGINISQAAREGLLLAIKREQEVRRLLKENKS